MNVDKNMVYGGVAFFIVLGSGYLLGSTYPYKISTK